MTNEQNQSELDTERPNFTIGYKKGGDDEIVVQLNKGNPDKFEISAMLTHAQAINTLPIINEARHLNKFFLEQKAKEIQKTKKAERKGKQTKKQRNNKDSSNKS